MKVLSCVLLFCSSFTYASPIQSVVPTNSPSRFRLDHANYTNGTGEQVSPQKSTLQAYITQLRSQFYASEHFIHESQLSIPQPPPAPLSHTKASRYGTLLGKPINNTALCTNKAKPSENDPNSTGYRELTTRVVDIINLIDRHGPECVILTLFILVPLAYLVLGMLELTVKQYTREQFPHRGRDRIRLFGPERQFRAWSNLQREQLLQNEKRWWQMRRPRC